MISTEAGKDVTEETLREVYLEMKTSLRRARIGRRTENIQNYS
jgi:hypothetical protein